MSKGRNGYTKIKGLPLMMRVSYFGYPNLYPSYFEWLHAMFMYIGNGNLVNEEGEFEKMSPTPALQAARHKKIPGEWFTAPPETKKLYPFYDGNLLSMLHKRKVEATPEIRKHLATFLDYIELNAMNPVTEDYNGKKTNVVTLAQEVLTRKR